MMNDFLITTGLAVAGILFTTSASAQISGTYVPAENLANTFQSSDGTSSMAVASSAGALWRDSTGGSLNYEIAGGFAYEPSSTDAEIVTTITGLTAGQSYDVNVVFGKFIFNSYAFDAGFTSGSLTNYPNGSATNTGLDTESTLVDIYEVSIGTTTADVDGEIDVFLGPNSGGGTERFVYTGVAFSPATTQILLGDVNLDGTVDFLDISPFIAILSGGTNQAEADCNESGNVDFLDISPFISILSGS